MSDAWATWAKPGVEKDASSPLWKLHTQGFSGAERKLTFLLLYRRVHGLLDFVSRNIPRISKSCAHVKGDVIQAPVRAFWAEDGHSAPLPCHGKCSEVIKTPIFAAVLRCTGDPGVPMLLSLRSSRGYCGLEQCQGQSPLGNVTASPAQAASTWLPLRAGLANAELASPWRKIRLDKCFYPSNVTLWSQWWSVLEWSGKSCVGAAWAVARVGELCLGCGRLCRGKLEE